MMYAVRSASKRVTDNGVGYPRQRVLFRRTQKNKQNIDR